MLRFFILLLLTYSALPAAAQRPENISRQTGEAALNDGAMPAVKTIGSKELRQLMKQSRKEWTRRMVADAMCPSHSVRLTLGFAPIVQEWVPTLWDSSDSGNSATDVFHSKYYETIRMSVCAWSFEYAYRFSRRWEVGFVTSFTSFSSELCSVVDNYPDQKLREYYVSLMPAIRFFWMDRGRVRLYSSLEFGFQYASRRSYFEDHFASKWGPEGQFTFFGIQVGKKTFFSAELGVGCRGVVNIGIGRKINTKKTRR